MSSRKLVEYTEVAPGMVKIESQLEGLLTLDRYISLARDLLENGLEASNNEKLKDMGTPDVFDNILLYREMEKTPSSNIREVSFKYKGKEYIVNLNNIDNIIAKRPEVDSHVLAVRDAVDESFER